MTNNHRSTRARIGCLLVAIFSFLVAGCDATSVPTNPDPSLVAKTLGLSWFREHTGPRPGHVLTKIDGDLVLTAADAGKTFKDLDVAGTIDVRAAAGVVLKDVRAWQIVSDLDGSSPGRNVQVSYCDIHGELLTPTPIHQDLVTDGIYTNCNIHGGFRGVHLRHAVNLVGVWVHDLRGMPDNTHRESFLSNGMTPDGHAVIVSSWLEAGSWDDLSGEVALYGDFSPIHHVVIAYSVLMDSGSYQLYAGSLDNKPHPDANHIVVVGNTFGRAPTGHPPGAQYGHVDGFDANAPGNRWAGNTELDGTPIPEP